MSNKSKLDALLIEYQEAQEQTDYACMIMQSDWIERQNARDKMNQAYKHMEQVDAHFYTIWEQFHNLRNYNRHRIETLRHEAKYASESRRKAIDAEIGDLQKETNKALVEAKKRATNDHKAAYDQSERNYAKAKASYEETMMEYEFLKATSDRLKAQYDQAKKAYENSEDQPAP